MILSSLIAGTVAATTITKIAQTLVTVGTICCAGQQVKDCIENIKEQM